MKDIKVKESDLEIDKVYYFDNTKECYGVFKGFLKDKTPTFEPIISNGYGKNYENGLIEFSPISSWEWILKQ